jgi:(5-formylfuran-3-yl)methyl phosphate synthase
VSLLSPRFFRRLSRVSAAHATQARSPAAKVPALLVSVRNALEARAAVAGGCDLLDIKEPDRGSLGMADAEAITAVAQCAAECGPTGRSLPCSAALGELVEWKRREPEFSPVPGIGYVKFGSAGIDSAAHWSELWRAVQHRFAIPASRNLRWVAVAYADWQAAAGLAPSQLLDAARTVHCDVFLIDTFDKSSGTLLKLMDLAELRQLSDSAHQAGLKIALAGGLRLAQFGELAKVCPDIVGVRGAACAGGSRTAPISATAVRDLKRELMESFAGQHEPSTGPHNPVDQ